MLLELDAEQLPLALKNNNKAVVNVVFQNQANPLKASKWKTQKRLFGKFMKEKAQSAKKRKRLGRPCPLCNKPLKSKKALSYHLNSTACPMEKGDRDIDELLQESRRVAKLHKLDVKFGNQESPQAQTPIVNITNNVSYAGNELNSASSLPSISQDTVDQYVARFEKSFTNPVFGSSNRAPSTIKKLVSSVKQIVRLCNYQNVSEIFSSSGIEKLKTPFSKNCFSTRKGTCQAWIEFVEFLEMADDFEDEKIRTKLLRLKLLLKKAYDSFCRGSTKDDSLRRVKLSEAIRNGELPTCSEVVGTYNYLENKLSEASDPGGKDFKDFVAFVAFALVKRCAIRPGALSLMTIKEFLNPVYKNSDNDTVLVHVKGKKSA